MRRFLLALALMTQPVTGWAQEAAETQATFRSGVDLVTVSATVRDSKGRLVTNLTKQDFEVIDRGERRTINEFRSERAPLSLAILFDVSGSMDVADRATAAKFAAFHLLNALDEGRDEAGLFAFDSRLREVAPFTVDTRALKGALGEVDPFGATSLHDAISAAAERVATRPDGPPRGGGVDRRHRYVEPVDAGAGVGERGRHRRAGLHHRDGIANRRSGLRSRHPGLDSGRPPRRLAPLKTSRAGPAVRCTTAAPRPRASRRRAR